MIDDQRDSADLLAVLLQYAVVGSSYQVFYDGAEALAAMTLAPPDAVVSDVQMPGMNGHALARAVRDLHPRGSAPLLIAMSGNSAEVARATELRTFDHALLKPLDIDRLVALLESIA